MHFDVWLRDACIHKHENLQASYVLPSIGNFDEHISGCDPTNTGVPGGWRPEKTGTSTGACQAIALKGEIRNTKLAMCAPFSIKAQIGAPRCNSTTISPT